MLQLAAQTIADATAGLDGGSAQPLLQPQAGVSIPLAQAVNLLEGTTPAHRPVTDESSHPQPNDQPLSAERPFAKASFVCGVHSSRPCPAAGTPQWRTASREHLGGDIHVLQAHIAG